MKIAWLFWVNYIKYTKFSMQTCKEIYLGKSEAIVKRGQINHSHTERQYFNVAQGQFIYLVYLCHKYTLTNPKIVWKCHTCVVHMIL